MSTANPATSNTDGVKQQDRTGVGPQPDNTPVAPTTPPSTGPGSGTVTSVSAGAGLTAAPNPIEAAGTISMPNVGTPATVGDSTHVARVTTDAQGRVSALSAVAIAFPPSVGDYPFNVKLFGALGDGSTDDTTAIQNAANALTVAGRGALFFPDGRYLISSMIIIGDGRSYSGTPPLPYNANFTILGSGRMSAVIIQTVSGQGGIYVNLTGGSNYAWNRAECFNLGLRVGNGVTAGTAIKFDYGATPVISSEQPSGSVIHGVDIGRDSPSFSGGWTAGILINNPWKMNIYDVNAFGCDAGNVVPTSGAGSGNVIELVGGFNVLIEHIYASFWQRGIVLDGIGGLASQGILMVDVIMVAVMEGLHVLPDAGISNIKCVNWLVDQGNSPNAGLANVAFYFDGDSGGGRGNISLVACDWLQVTGSGLSCGIYFNNISSSTVTAANSFANGTSGAVVLAGNSMNNIFAGCRYAGGTITCGASTDGNEFNCTQTSTFSNAGGAGNVALTTLF